MLAGELAQKPSLAAPLIGPRQTFMPTVLLLDNDELVQRTLAHALQAAGHDVHSSREGTREIVDRPTRHGGHRQHHGHGMVREHHGISQANSSIALSRSPVRAELACWFVRARQPFLARGRSLANRSLRGSWLIRFGNAWPGADPLPNRHGCFGS